jgi:hypothetical protein
MGILTSLLLATVFQINPMPIDQSPFQGVVMLRGRAVDERGRGIANVRVDAVASSDTATTVTNAAGNFFFLDLLPGSYTLNAQPRPLPVIEIIRPVPLCKPPTTEKFELEAGYEYAAVILVEGCRG